MFKLGKMLCYWTSRVMVPNCTFMFSNTSFELSACFPHVAQSTRTTQHLNSVGCFTRNRSSNLKSFTRRGIMKGLRFIHKMTLLTATTLPWLKKCVGCGTKQICPNQHVAQIGRSLLDNPRWFIKNWLQLGIALNNVPIFLNNTINVFFAKGEYLIKQATRCSLHLDLLTKQSCWETFLKCAAAAWIHSSLYALCLNLSAKNSACCW